MLEAQFLAAALEAGRWLEGLALETDDGLTWPVQVEGETRSGVDLYSGSPGVVLFFLEAHHAAGRDAYLGTARSGADRLAAEVRRRGAEIPAGLYTGLAGLGFTVGETWRATAEPRYREAAVRCIDLLRDRAERTGHGVRWNESTDVISGSAGIGLFLLYAARELERPDAIALARSAGDHLMELGIAEHGGLKWAMTPDFERRMPNFSHGTAGVGFFLVALHDATGEHRYLEAARAGAAYLDAIAAPAAPPTPGGGALIFHSEPGREDLFYLGWCHGPAGTARFLRTLEHASGEQRWGALSGRLVAGLRSCGLPGERPPGYWNNVGPCCGTAGIADFLLALHRLDGNDEDRALAGSLLEDLLARSTTDDAGRRWTHAEHRVRPELLTTQTGLMQGAAGIGLVLLRAYAHETGRKSLVVLPDEPWRQLQERTRARGE